MSSSTCSMSDCDVVVAGSMVTTYSFFPHFNTKDDMVEKYQPDVLRIKVIRNCVVDPNFRSLSSHPTIFFEHIHSLTLGNNVRPGTKQDSVTHKRPHTFYFNPRINFLLLLPLTCFSCLSFASFFQFAFLFPSVFFLFPFLSFPFLSFPFLSFPFLSPPFPLITGEKDQTDKKINAPERML